MTAGSEQGAVGSKSIAPKPRIRLSVVLICLLSTVFLPAVCGAQQPKKVPRIGYVSSGTAASESPRAEGLRLALRELGYIEGQNIAIEYRYAEGKRTAELVRLKVDVIVAAGGNRRFRLP